MPDVLEKFARETIDQLLGKLPPEELLKHLSTEDRLNGLSLDDLKAALARRLKENGSPPESDDK